MCQQHAAALNLDADDVFLGSYGLDLSVLELVVDGGSGRFGIHGVEQANGYTGELGGLDAGGMQDLCAEIGEFGRFFKVELTNGLGVLYHARVVVVHAVDVCPYLDFLCLDGCTDKTGCVV